MSKYVWNIAKVTSMSADSLPPQRPSQHKTFPPWLVGLELHSASADTDTDSCSLQPDCSASQNGTRTSPYSSLGGCVCLSVFVCVHTEEVNFSFMSEILHCFSYTVSSVFGLCVAKFR